MLFATCWRRSPRLAPHLLVLLLMVGATGVTQAKSTPPVAATAPAVATTVPLTATLTNPPELFARVDVEALHLRDRPGTEYASLGLVPYGTHLRLLARDPACQWWWVQDAQGGAGWVVREYVTVIATDPGAADAVTQIVVDAPCARVEVEKRTAFAVATDAWARATAQAAVDGITDYPPPRLNWERFLSFVGIGIGIVLALGALVYRGRRSGLPILATVRMWGDDLLHFRRGKSLWSNQPPASPAAYLEGRLGSGEAVYAVLPHRTITVGQGDTCDLIIDDRFGDAVHDVEQLHAQIEFDGKSHILVDRSSMSGVYVNNRRTRENLLLDGATIRIGTVEYVFHQNQA